MRCAARVMICERLALSRSDRLNVELRLRGQLHRSCTCLHVVLQSFGIFHVGAVVRSHAYAVGPCNMLDNPLCAVFGADLLTEMATPMFILNVLWYLRPMLGNGGWLGCCMVPSGSGAVAPRKWNPSDYYDNKTKRFLCPLCPATFKRAKYLTVHIKENCRKRPYSELHATPDSPCRGGCGTSTPPSPCGSYMSGDRNSPPCDHHHHAHHAPEEDAGPIMTGQGQVRPEEVRPDRSAPLDEVTLPHLGGLSRRGELQTDAGGDGLYHDGDVRTASQGVLEEDDTETVDTASLLQHLLGGGPPDMDSSIVEDLISAQEVEEVATSMLGEEMEGAMDAEVGMEPGAARTNTDQTAKGLAENRDSPIFEGARITVLQAAFLMLSLKREGHIRDNVFDMMCRVIHEVLLPDGNLFPRSLYLMRRVIGCRTTEEVSVHVCVNDCCVFGRVSDLDKLPVAERDRLRDSTCEHCGERKFNARVGKLQPRKTFQYFGVKNAIRRLFANPDFVKLRGTSREDNGYYQSQECARLHEAAGVDKDDPSASVYDVGLDWGQVYDKSVHSMGIVVLRCADLPPTHRSQRRFCMPVALIPGPKEPKDLWTYMQFVAEEFAGVARTTEQIDVDFASGKQLHASMEVQACTNAEDPNAPPEAVQHIFLCSGVYGDTPAQKKVSCSQGHSAYLACHQCCMRGVRGPNNRGMYFPLTAETGATYGFFGAGEREAIAAKVAGASSARPCSVGDDAPKLDHDDCVARAQAVDDGRMQGSDVGCHGISPFIKCLPYLHYVNAFPLPIAHAALQGIGKMLLKLTMDGLTHAQKRTVRARGGDMSEPADIGRRYKCVCTKIGHYTMEDLINFLEFGCVRLLDGVLAQELANIWRLFRRGILFFLRERHVSDLPSNAREAWDSLYAFGKAMHERFGVTACKYNLHIILCRVLDQERWCGDVRQMTEYWIEMMVQFAKSSVRYRTTRFPEKVLSGDWCMDEALQMWKLLWPGANLKTFDQWVPKFRAAQHRGVGLDDADLEGNMLLGNGKPIHRMTTVQVVRARAALKSCIEEMTPAGWTAADAATADIMAYQYADLHTFQNVYSRAYTRATRRISHLVRCMWTVGANVIEYIGDVHFFILARAPDGNEDHDIRLGVCDLFELHKVERTIGCAWTATYPDTPSFRYHGVRLQEMRDKMVLCACDEPGRMQFLEYGTTSGTGRFGKGSHVPDGVAMDTA
jgi:hypothetical protein